MKKHAIRFRLAAAAAVVAFVGFLPLQVGALAVPQGTFTYHVGDAFLTSFDPSFGPVVTMARNEDRISVTGTGSFSLFPRWATGGGTIVHTDAAGNVVAQGTWEAVNVLSFRNYGDATPQGLPETFFGGKLGLIVKLMPEGAPPGTVFWGIMWIDCTLGSNIPTRAVEGIELNVPGVINFAHEVSGATLFVQE